MQALIVEDEVLTAMHLEAALEDLGVQGVGIAPDMPAALALAERAPDLALVDMNLRDGLTGPHIAERLAQRGVAILFVTANPAQIGAQRRLAIGILGKPFDEDELARAVEQVRTHRQSSEAQRAW